MTRHDVRAQPFDREGRLSGHVFIFQVKLMLIQQMASARARGVQIRSQPDPLVYPRDGCGSTQRLENSHVSPQLLVARACEGVSLPLRSHCTSIHWFCIWQVVGHDLLSWLSAVGGNYRRALLVLVLVLAREFWSF